MTVIATKDMTLGNLIKAEQWAEMGYCREAVTVNVSGDTELKVGTVLGLDSVSGKYIVAASGAANGADVPAAIYMGSGTGFEPTVTALDGVDTSVVCLVQGPAMIGAKALDLGTGITVDAVKAAFADKGVVVLDQVTQALNV